LNVVQPEKDLAASGITKPPAASLEWAKDERTIDAMDPERPADGQFP
jgi:hypothetical protein